MLVVDVSRPPPVGARQRVGAMRRRAELASLQRRRRTKVSIADAVGLKPVGHVPLSDAKLRGMPAGWCRHCLTDGELTFEHLPPRSARNRGWVRQRPDPFDYGRNQVLKEWMEGHGRPALCETCQHNPPEWRYPEEYNAWRATVIAQLQQWVVNHGPVVRQGEAVDLRLEYDRMPGRFSRMVLGMLLSCMDDPLVARASPEVRAAIGAGLPSGSPPPEGGTIGGWRLILALADETWGFTTGPVIGPGPGVFISFVDPPFAFYLYKGPPAALHASDGTDITHWAQWAHNERFDGPRRHAAAFQLPFRFRAYDFAEYQFMLLLGALYAVSQSKVTPKMDHELLNLAEKRLVRQASSNWELTEHGQLVLDTAPLLHDRLQRPLEPPSTGP